MKPMLASDFLEKKLKFPLVVQPKIDGVRGLNMLGRLTGRSGKEHANRYTSDFYSQQELVGFDGELVAEHECHPDLCRLTTSALNTIEGQPFTLWWLFDYVTPETAHLPYLIRYEKLQEKVYYLQQVMAFQCWGHLRVVPFEQARNLDELNEIDTRYLEQGYEGTIIRAPNGAHKQGRSTATEGGLLRIKRFIEEEAVVVAIEEGQQNLNEATLSVHGYTERSTHQENMVPNGMVGNLHCKVVKDVKDPSTGKILMQAGQVISVAAGRMSHEERRHFFIQQHRLIGQTIKFQFFPKGIKDKPRFPTFQSIRAASDI